MKSVQQLLKYAASSVLLHEDQEVDPEDAGELILVEIEGVGEMILDVAKSQEYCETLTASRQADRRGLIEGGGEGENTQVDKKGSATASLLLQLEFVFEVLENKTFHRQLLPLIEAESGSDVLQSYFLELSEQVLQLLALSTRAQGSVPSTDMDKKKTVHSYLSVQLGDSAIDITVSSLGRSVNTWCLDILKATQKVLDAPSFVAILQELLSHEDPSVRQTALHILSKRLYAMSQGKRPGAEEVSSWTEVSVIFHLKSTSMSADLWLISSLSALCSSISPPTCDQLCGDAYRHMLIPLVPMTWIRRRTRRERETPSRMALALRSPLLCVSTY